MGKQEFALLADNRSFFYYERQKGTGGKETAVFRRELRKFFW